jgi:FkbM family methyltransferase
MVPRNKKENRKLIVEKTSEKGQEYFVLKHTGHKQNGYFVDIGAADGITASNSFALEKWFKWNGICVDPNPVFMQSLMNCRDSSVSNLCVYSESGKIVPFKFFNNPESFYGWNFRSGLTEFVGIVNPEVMDQFREINVFTISLNDLLELYHAPVNIDYISLDTEGSEYEILKSFNFKKYNVKCFTVEHADSPLRDHIFELMTSNGYRRADEDQPDNEDWYVKL